MAPRCPGSSALVWLLLLALAPALALAQASATPPSPWLELARETRPGQTLAILTTDGTWHEGRLAGFSEAGVDLDVGNTRVQLMQERVWEVWTSSKRSRHRGVKPGFFWGVGVGVALGTAAYFAQGDCSDPTSVCAEEGKFTGGDVALTGLVSGGIGALIGLAVGGSVEEPRRLYIAPARGAPPAAASAVLQLGPFGIR